MKHERYEKSLKGRFPSRSEIRYNVCVRGRSTRETLGKVAIEFSIVRDRDGQNVPDTTDGMMEVSQASHHPSTGGRTRYATK